MFLEHISLNRFGWKFASFMYVFIYFVVFVCFAFRLFFPHMIYEQICNFNRGFYSEKLNQKFWSFFPVLDSWVCGPQGLGLLLSI